MKKTTNKLALLLLGFSAQTAPIFDFWWLGVQNNTDYTLEVEVSRASLFCPDKTYFVPNQTYWGLKQGACCLKEIKVRKPGGSWIYYNPPKTGAGISCRDNGIQIDEIDGVLKITKIEVKTS